MFSVWALYHESSPKLIRGVEWITFCLTGEERGMWLLPISIKLIYPTCHVQILSIILYICLGAIEQNWIELNQRTVAGYIELCSSSIFCFHLCYTNSSFSICLCSLVEEEIKRQPTKWVQCFNKLVSFLTWTFSWQLTKGLSIELFGTSVLKERGKEKGFCWFGLFFPFSFLFIFSSPLLGSCYLATISGLLNASN